MSVKVITDIQPLEENPNFRVLFIDGVAELTIPSSTLVKFALSIGQEWNDDLANTMQSDEDIEVASKMALGLIAMKSWGVKELATRLVKRGIEPDIATITTEQLEGDGWLDDFTYACARIREWIRKEPASRAWLTRKLQERELSDETIANALDEERGGQSEQDAATELAIIRLAKVKDQDVLVIRRKVISALSRRGFSTDVGSEALRMAQSENA